MGFIKNFIYENFFDETDGEKYLRRTGMTRMYKKLSNELNKLYEEIPLNNPIAKDGTDVYFYCPITCRVFQVWWSNYSNSTATGKVVRIYQNISVNDLKKELEKDRIRLGSFGGPNICIGDRDSQPNNHWIGLILKAGHDFDKNLLKTTALRFYPYFKRDNKFFKMQEISEDEYEKGLAISILGDEELT